MDYRNTNILQFKELLDKFQLDKDKAEFEMLNDCLQSIDKQMSQVLNEMESLKEEVNQITGKSFKSTVNKTTDELESIINNTKNKANEYKKTLYDSIDAAIENTQISGKEALIGFTNSLHIKEAINMFKTMNEKIIECCDKAIDKLTQLVNQAHDVKGHAKNALRAAAGKETLDNGKHDFNNGVISKIQNYLFKVMESIDNINKSVNNSYFKLEAFDQTTQLQREAHKGIKERIEIAKQAKNQDNGDQQLDSPNKENLLNKEMSPTR